MRLLALGTLLLALLVLVGCSDKTSGSRTVSLLTAHQLLPHNAQWVAFQDGNGPWRQVQPAAEGTYACRVADPQGRYGFAVVSTEFGSPPQVSIFYSTLAEATNLTCLVQGALTSGMKTLTGSITGMSANDLCYVACPNNETQVSAPHYDLYAYNETIDLGASLYRGNQNDLPAKIILKRGVSVRQGQNTYDLDFTGPDVFTPTEHRVITCNQGTPFNGFVYYVTREGAGIPVGGIYALLPGVLTSDYAVLPTPYPGDTYNATIYTPIETDAGYMKTLSFSTPRDIAYNEPPPLGNFTVTSPNASFAGTTVNWTAYPEAKGYCAGFASSNSRWEIHLSSGWVGSHPTCSVPDFATVTGWQSSWDFAGQSSYAYLDAYTGTLSFASIISVVNSRLNMGPDGMEITVVGKMANWGTGRSRKGNLWHVGGMPTVMK